VRPYIPFNSHRDRVLGRKLPFPCTNQLIYWDFLVALDTRVGWLCPVRHAGGSLIFSEDGG
jgi:hypothetical protein